MNKVREMTVTVGELKEEAMALGMTEEWAGFFEPILQAIRDNRAVAAKERATNQRLVTKAAVEFYKKAMGEGGKA